MSVKSRRKTGSAGVTVGQVSQALGRIAPLELAEEWDNVGLLIGRRSDRVRRVLLTIDLTAAVLDEAVADGADMVVAYHPVIFKPLKRLLDEGGVAYSAARAGLAVYSPHTAWDAVAGGANDVLAAAIGIVDPQPLAPAWLNEQAKVVVFVPPEDLAKVQQAAFAAGAGNIDSYSQCGFFGEGTGTFFGQAGSKPAKGKAGRFEQIREYRLEMVAPRAQLAEVIQAIHTAHSYQTPAIDVYPAQRQPAGVGMGRIGELARPMPLAAFVATVKRACGVRDVLLAGGREKGGKKIDTVACCAGSCGKLYEQALAAGADVLVTGELRHHDALAAAEAGMAVICTQHSHSERLSLPAMAKRLSEQLPGLPVKLSSQDADPFRVA